MSDLNPTEIYRRYQRNELEKGLAVDYLKSIIESNSDEGLRVQSVTLLGEMDLGAEEIYEYFEQLLTSDLNEEVRLAAVQAIINNFLEKGERLLKWVIKHEQSCDCLLGIYHTFSSKESVLVNDLLLLMEENIGKNYRISHDLLPKEAMALELLGRHLCNLYVFLEAKQWKFYDLKIINNRVVSIKIENLYNSINSKFFSLFSGLQELILYDCKLNDAFHLSVLSRLIINGTEDGQLDSIDEIKGFENLKNLRELDLSINNISEITKLDLLTNLVKLDLSQNDIKEIKGFETLKNLEILNLEWNNIGEIKNLQNLVNLKELNLSDNEDIAKIKGLRKLKSLEILRLYNNFLIVEIEGLEELKNLRILDISKDSGMIDLELASKALTMIVPFEEGMDVKEYTKNQERLNKNYEEYRKILENNRDYIREINGLDTLTNLEELFLVGNSILEIRGLEKLKKLRLLNLSKNKISKIKGLDKLVNLEELDLSYNPITNMEGLENHGKLRSVNFEECELETNKIEHYFQTINRKNIKIYF